MLDLRQDVRATSIEPKLLEPKIQEKRRTIKILILWVIFFRPGFRGVCWKVFHGRFPGHFPGRFLGRFLERVPQYFERRFVGRLAFF